MIVVTAVAVMLLPFLAAVTGLLGSRWPRGAPGTADPRANRRAAWIAVIPTAVSVALAVWLAYTWWTGPYEGVTEAGTLTVIDTGALPISMGLAVTDLSVLVGLLVTTVALAVQIYSVGYLEGDSRYPSYSAFISLFTSAMLLVIYAEDLLVLYVGWEVMGLCSYLLIGHWWEDRANSRAAVKAFLVTRLGDVGFLFGLFTLGVGAGSLRISDVIDRVPQMSTTTLVIATMLLLAGVAGKSAQVPLHTWLPDAMAGPTPISALIHAATMVAAGIFMVARLFPVFEAAGPTLDVLAVLAALGMLGAALAALAQDDLKRVLAYSTVSQLAYMAAALAARAENVAVFHLLTHGAFKALLFLCAGAVIHAVGSNLMRDMGGLRRTMPVTFVTMTIGFAALMGLPPASGFFSKDAVVVAVERAGAEGLLTDAAGWLLYACTLATVAVTGAYATRAWLRTFFGEARAAALPEPAPGTAHVFTGQEAPLSMRAPIIVLAVPALLLGFAGLTDVHWGPAAITVGLALLGATVTYVAWRADPAADPARLLGPFRVACERAFFVDHLYRALFVWPVLRLSRAVVTTDAQVVDGAVRGSGRITRTASGLLRFAQNGNAQLYLSGVLAGVLLIAVGAVMLG
ncbi:NADH-quinone oxidoreductase subunit L [Spongiactinospora sp. TRM90649]|uniref:NADH-quinone oxidoreductase subunit 5 family protein n=1 Tax=Spongiactinospora sp. TRM90649 TaxID=3031114 RepID=UPI0023F96541|nr:NADH-quinone oxidoreductase subunit L [Spongiactinospora sp. TRM90649]MDF5755041.1 NADH-quinone oxidoreductase subunit L [Spongiactinospora sp. TRM90649]